MRQVTLDVRVVDIDVFRALMAAAGNLLNVLGDPDELTDPEVRAATRAVRTHLDQLQAPRR